MTQQTLSVVVAGDLCMRAPLDSLMGTPAEKAIFEEIGPVLMQADVRIVNLENPLIDGGIPIAKSGPNLKGPESGVNIVKTAGFDAAILANNHIGDFGGEGVLRTLSILDKHGIGRTGAGADLAEARKPWIIRCGGHTLAVLAAAENEFGVAGEETPGSNGLGLRRLCSDIAAARQTADFVLMVMHGGNECNPVPSPTVVDRYRTLADAGADAVIGMHPHCPQGWEIYRDKPIVYSTGNFLFGSAGTPDPRSSWYYGYLPRIDFGHGQTGFSVIPYRFSPDLTRITVMTGEEKERMMDYLMKLSAFLSDPAALLRHYESWCVYEGRDFARWLRYEPAGCDPMETAADPGMLALRNAFTCEAHNDLLKTYLKILCDGRLEECARGIPAVQALMKMP